MYLKSIEMQGFKSFAGKMTLEFHDGVTAIVGPNGSGKSNVADAVRWVLGEQSAKQLRGGNMQDVIFAGTQSRKPLGFATVAITLDNSDRKLNIDYPEVTVTRRLYRSGESEYKINGGSCRLKDIQELFYDTGIGKEGYSMIGQGQIDKILSGKPEERRELFDEAAGIVKYKRRKAATLKKLEKEEANLTRITDILMELTKQVVPLEKQAEKAKIYLSKKEQLKERDLAIFLINDEKIEKDLKELNEKDRAIKEELEEAEEAFEAAKQQYEEKETLIRNMDETVDALHEKLSEANINKQAAKSQIQLLQQQVQSADKNREMFEKQLADYQAEESRRLEVLEGHQREAAELGKQIAEAKEKVDRAEEEYEKAGQLLAEKNEEAERDKNDLIALLNSRSSIKEKNQRYITLNEQIQVRQSSLTARVLRLTDDKKRIQNNEEKIRSEYKKICADIEQYEQAIEENKNTLLNIKQELTKTDTAMDQLQTNYHRQQSLLESLTNLAERYEGYGNSVRRVMEQKDRNPGIMGVVAEIISTKKKYETAIETALGGSIQNIVTDNETTAKYMIEFLKRGHYGRATFLPMTAINDREFKAQELREEGVLGIASELVEYDNRFQGVVNRLLGKTYVIDTIDHAIAIGRLYKHKLRMVTLEGELISPGGSMSGGSYRNNANLLGRARQIDELKLSVKECKKELEEKEGVIEKLKEERNTIRIKQNDLNDKLQQFYLDKNTAEVNLKAAMEQTDSIMRDNDVLSKENHELLKQRKEIQSFMENVNAQIDASSKQEQEINKKMQEDTLAIEKMKEEEHSAHDELEKARMEYNSVQQKREFVKQNVSSAKEELNRIKNDMEITNTRILNDEYVRQKTLEDIKEANEKSKHLEREAEKLSEELVQKNQEKEELNASYRAIFKQREDISEKRNLLDKESYRLEAAIEKSEEDREKNINYLWEEYEITPTQIEKNPDDERSCSQLQKEIAELRTEIRGLGNVNVNAIEEYKDVKERHDFLSAQYEDVVKAAENLQGIIAELDVGMHNQFTEQFANIQKEFNKVFKQLFGGGMGSLELVEDEDILEAGVRIIAQPPGKKVQNMMQLSGGEKTLTAIALLFAIQNLKPSPFCLLDEIEAALDDANVDHFAKYLHRLKGTQFIVITHRRGTMTSADRLYGITMQEKGISTMVSVDLIESQLN